jgi:hypothetical protein
MQRQLDDIFNNQEFLEWMNREDYCQENKQLVEYAIATVPNEILKELNHVVKQDVTSNQVLLSEYTIKKQKAKHPEILFSHYQMLQMILDTGTCIRETRSHYASYHVLVFHKVDDQQYLKATIKITADGARFYLQSLHYVDPQRYFYEIERGKVFRSALVSSFELKSQQRRRCMDFIDV